ncbi:hypothetical protein [Massilia glaciei]|nr:hypothetical protein [Massilia glaciei]
MNDNAVLLSRSFTTKTIEIRDFDGALQHGLSNIKGWSLGRGGAGLAEGL